MPGSGNTNTWEIGSLHSIRKDKLKNKQYSIRSASIAAERKNIRYNEHPREESVSPVPYYTIRRTERTLLTGNSIGL